MKKLRHCHPMYRQRAQKNWVKIARVTPEISPRTDRQTDRQACSSQYLDTAVASEVKMACPNFTRNFLYMFPVAVAGYYSATV